MNFNNVRNKLETELYNYNGSELLSKLSQKDKARVLDIRRYWDFYEGYHWEGMETDDRIQVTKNYIQTFINKYVAFELGKGFSINTSDILKNYDIIKGTEVKSEEGTTLASDKDITTITEFLEEVWKSSQKDVFCVELGQSKAITGDGWVQIRYISAKDEDSPFTDSDSKGKIVVSVVPTSIIFPKYSIDDKGKLEEVTVAYPIEVPRQGLLKTLFQSETSKKIIKKQVWTKNSVEVFYDDVKSEEESMQHNLGIIPFVQIKNYPIAGKENGLSDVEPLIPLNIELNSKTSNVSEIIDYHAAPITLVFGMKISSLEKGVNKVWGGLPKDARVENLQLQGDLTASQNYTNDLKQSLHEIGAIPEGALGGTQAISNTSGVALQFMNMPLVEKINVKKLCTKSGLELVNKIILLVALKNDLIKKPEGIPNSVFFDNEVKIVDTLPKDSLITLQELAQEINLGLESRTGALKRLGRPNIADKLKEIDSEAPYIPKVDKSTTLSENGNPKINSGMTNGEDKI